MNHRIDHNNYINYALDFLEGNLDPAMHVAFERFIEAHPDIRQELDSLSGVHLQCDESVFPSRCHLKKTRDPLPEGAPQMEIECW